MTLAHRGLLLMPAKSRSFNRTLGFSCCADANCPSRSSSDNSSIGALPLGYRLTPCATAGVEPCCRSLSFVPALIEQVVSVDLKSRAAPCSDCC